MSKSKNTPGFFGGLIGFVLGLAISFAATIAIRSAYNESTAQLEDGIPIDPIGLTYRSLAGQDTPPQPSLPNPKYKNSPKPSDVVAEESSED